jgi:hypothetical protein
MMDDEELEVIARRVIDSNQFMTIGTADDEGVPWVSPVWYAPVDYREFLWVSDPEARHSSNIAARPRVAIVIFDSRGTRRTPLVAQRVSHSMIFQKESLRLILPPANSNRSHPRTSMGSPVVWVPRIVHSDTPRSPHVQWRAWL